MAKSNGYVVYNGPSMLDPKSNIVAIITMKTSNAKTGDMAQLWILDADTNPVEATKTGQDSSVCGSCPHRHYNGGACYVNVGQAPNSVYKAYKRGSYAFGLPAYTDKGVRLGAYGDPAALPYIVLYKITACFSGHTGYTHQRKHKHFDDRILTLVQVSADTPKQALKAQKLGGRTFRVKLVGDSLLPNELECLADTKGMTCSECLLCDGNKANIAITVHGSRSKRFKSQLIELKEV